MHSMSLRFPFILSAFAVSIVSAAGCASADKAPESTTRNVDESLYGLGTIAPLWPNHTVPVCFQDPAAHPDLQMQIPIILERSWTRAADITFTGFGGCNALNRVAIKFADVLDKSTGPGFRGTTDHLGYGVDTIILISDDTPDFTHFTYEVIHEMGHALGFAHEMKRPDNWSNGKAFQCGDAPTDSDYSQYAAQGGGIYLSPTYDPNSIMNYCNPAGFPTSLSAGDIAGASAASAYGPTKYVAPVITIPHTPTHCVWSIADCYNHITFSCDPAVNSQPGDHMVLKSREGMAAFTTVATNPYDFVDYASSSGEMRDYEVCMENGSLDACTDPVAVHTVPTRSVCGAGTGPGDPGNTSGLIPTCGKPPLRACQTISVKPGGSVGL